MEGLTAERSQHALDKVKAEYEVENGRLAIITEDRYQETYELMSNNFVPDEPLCQFFCVKWNKDFENITQQNLKGNVSLAMISKDTNELMGVRILSVVKKSDPPPDFSHFLDEPLRELYGFLTHKEKEANFFNRYGVDEGIHFFTLAVNRKYRRLGLGSRLLAAAMAMSRELGYKAIKGEGTSNFSQRIYEKHGFEVLLTMPYDVYFYKGQPISNGTGEHRMAKVFGIRL